MTLVKSWARGLPFGLPNDFDFGLIRHRGDVITLLAALPNGDRGEAARSLYEQCRELRPALAYAALIEAWDHDDNETVDAFGSLDDFASALREVAPPIRRKRMLSVWRGVAVRNAHPAEAAIGLSWTRSRDVACWFATTYGGRGELTGIRPFVFKAWVEPETILAFHNGRHEQEVLIDLAELETTAVITVDGSNIHLDDLAPDSSPPAEILASWCEAGLRYERRHK